MSQQNYENAELEKFTSLAAHWWDTSGELKTLHQVNPLRLKFITDRISLNQAKVLDIGCGGGILAESMAKDGAEVTGIDMSKAVIEVAKLHQFESGTKVTYHCQSAEAWAEKYPNHYDVVTCLEMLEHVPDPKSIVKAAASLVKPDGHLFFSTLNRNLKSYLLAIIGAEYVLKLLPKDTHDYAKFIRPAELTTWARQSGLTAREIKGIRYHLFSQTFSLTDDIAVNYLFHAVKSSEKNE